MPALIAPVAVHVTVGAPPAQVKAPPPAKVVETYTAVPEILLGRSAAKVSPVTSATGMVKVNVVFCVAPTVPLARTAEAAASAGIVVVTVPEAPVETSPLPTSSMTIHVFVQSLSA